MCCFGTRIFLLMFITILSFVLHKLYPILPVVGYYFIFANLLAFTMFSLFFKELLPTFVKSKTIHYFSLIGGFLGGLLSMAIFKKFSRDIFTYTELFLLVFWLVILMALVVKFNEIVEFLGYFYD
ncbi:L-arabinose ABC transporter [Campylobacter sp. faydin G-105]|uniref:L-arabinose ABC transporter n=1 Tax=Campylobacter anatolicus TaxID=2829105 RepID=UPI001BA1A2B2|nr:L-arabinose ABC transporter [Campylobacter anatolicus]MBR8461783.1 L-arabinose ABC transporter [Campylobacter anatolicus]